MPVAIKREPGSKDDGVYGHLVACPPTCSPTAALPDAATGPACPVAARTPEKVAGKIESGADSGHSSPAQHSAAGSTDGLGSASAMLGSGRGYNCQPVGTALGRDCTGDNDCSGDNDDDFSSSSSDCLSEADHDEPIDDDFGELTSLAWLQNANLLRNVGGSGGDEPKARRHRPKQVPPAAAGGVPDTGSQPQGPCSSGASVHVVMAPGSRQDTLARDVNSKPPYSFSCLIFMAIEESPQRRLPVKDIYDWIAYNFPYYKAAPLGWKNSVRHNLSLNKCFKKVERDENRKGGKGACWCVDPLFRPNLLQALRRSPYYPHHQMQIVSLTGSLSKFSKKLADEVMDSETTCGSPRVDIEAANALVSLRMPAIRREESPDLTPQVHIRQIRLSLPTGECSDALGEHGGRKRKLCDGNLSVATTATSNALAAAADAPSLDHTYFASSTLSSAVAGSSSSRIEQRPTSGLSVTEYDDDHIRLCRRDNVASRSNSEETSSSDGESAKRISTPMVQQDSSATAATVVSGRRMSPRAERNKRVLQAYGRATLAAASSRGGDCRQRRPQVAVAAKVSAATVVTAGGSPASRSLLSLASVASLAMMDAAVGRPLA